MIELRDYQRKAITSLFEYLYANPHKNPCLVIPTAGGKSLILAEFCRYSLTTWPGSRLLVLTHQKELVMQDARALKNLWNDSDIGIYSASIGCKQLEQPLIYASIQSIYKVSNVHFDVILIDEAHLVNNEEQGMYRKFIDRIRPSFVIGLTATPYRLGQGLITDGDSIFDDLIDVISIKELQQRGYLAMLRSKSTAVHYDLSKVRTRGGDYIESDLQSATSDFSTNEAVCDEIVKSAKFYQRKHILVFCTGIEHAETIAMLLKERGMDSLHVTGAMSQAERDERLYMFTSGQTTAMTNYGILCLDEETEILTSRGFVGIDDMTMDKKIAAWKEDGTIEFTNPKLIVRREREEWENMVFLDGKSTPQIRVTDNHRMVIRCGENRKKIKVVSAKDLVGKKSFVIPGCGYSEPEIMYCKQEEFKTSFSRQVIATAYNYRKKGIEKDKARTMAEDFVTRRRALRYKNPFELTLQECRFIGFFLGDGSSYNDRYSLSQSHAYEDNIKWVDNLLKDINIHFTKHEKKQKSGTGKDYVVWAFPKGTGGDGQLIENGIYPYIPYLKKDHNELFFGFSKDQLLALLDGFWYADGNHHAKLNYPKKAISKGTIELFNCLLAACSMRGIKAWIRPLHKAKDYYQQLYLFTWSDKTDWHYCDRSEKILETEHKKERVWCVTSTTSYLICKRKGKVFVTGNTTGFDYPNIDMIVLLRATLSPGLYMQMLGRGLRLKSEDNKDCLVLDFAENVMRHGPITEVIPPSERSKGEKVGAMPCKECPECLEIVPIQTEVCPSCGFEFPKHKRTWQLYAGDVNGGGYTTCTVQSWFIMPSVSRSNATPMYVIEYRVHEATHSKRDFILYAHEGYAYKKTLKLVKFFCDHYGIDIEEFYTGKSDEVTGKRLYDWDALMTEIGFHDPPRMLIVERKGKFDNIVDRLWEEDLEEIKEENERLREMADATRHSIMHI